MVLVMWDPYQIKPIFKGVNLDFLVIEEKTKRTRKLDQQKCPWP